MLPILMEVSLYVAFVCYFAWIHVKQIQDNNKNNSLTDIILWGVSNPIVEDMSTIIQLPFGELRGKHGPS